MATHINLLFTKVASKIIAGKIGGYEVKDLWDWPRMAQVWGLLCLTRNLECNESVCRK
jgi:hypothetical protein